MTQYAGLDVHGKETVFEIQDAEGATLAQGRFPTTPEGLDTLAERLEPGSTVGLETGTLSFFVARLLMERGLAPVVVDAHEVRVKAHRANQKSDRRDAHEICEGIRRDIYRTIVHVPSPEIQALRGLLSRRRHFVRQMTREVNAAKQLLKGLGLAHLSRRKQTTEASWEKLLGELAAVPDVAALLQLHFSMWRCAEQQRELLEAEIQRRQQPYEEELRRLQTIPGVGPVVSVTIKAALSDLTRFDEAKEVASYAGVVPTTSQSGSRDRHGHITKRGSAELRAMLCEAAHHARRPTSPLHPYFARVAARRGYRIAVTATAHRILRIAWAMLKKKSDFDASKLGVSRVPAREPRERIYVLDRDRVLGGMSSCSATS